MPEGPSIVILKNLCKPFKGKKIISVAGNTKIGKERMTGKKIIDFKSWGKHFLICFPEFTVKIHFLMFGSYRINEERELAPRLSLQFKTGMLNFYSCSVKFIEEDLDAVYDWATDVMSRRWNPAAAQKKIKASEDPVCDVLLDQHIFSGVGNIIKNEVLFRIRVHPMSIACKLPPAKLKELVAEAKNYSFDFLKWKKKIRAQKTLACAYKENLRSLQHSINKGISWKNEPAHILLRQLPKTLSMISQPGFFNSQF